MSTQFDPAKRLIAIQVHLFGPTGDIYARMALDTGASVTIVRNALLVTIGYDPDVLPKTVQMTTGSGVESAPRLTLDRIEALEQEREGFSVVAHTLPPSASLDGLLGLDFLRDRVLTLDFQRGEITLI
jgi:predicted aspartyl protease